MINPELIRTFLALAETKHFTKASERLHMTQPGVSQHLKKLEEYYGIPLVSRKSKTFLLTDAGKDLVAYGKRLFDEHRRFQDGLKTDDPHLGLCRFGSPGSLALKVFDILIEEKKKHSGLTIDMLVAPSASIVRYLKEEAIDVGLMSEEPKDPAIESEIFAKEAILLALPKGKRVTTLAALKELGFINHPDGFNYAGPLLARNFPEEFTGMADIPVSITINQLNRILDPVAEGLGFAILPETACRRYFRRNEINLVQLPKRVDQTIYKAVRRGEKLPFRYGVILEKLRR